MADDGNIVYKIDNSERIFGEDLEYYHVFDDTRGHLLFTEHEIEDARERAQRKAMMIHQAVVDDDPWWKVWAQVMADKKWIQKATRKMEKKGTVGSFTAW